MLFPLLQVRAEPGCRVAVWRGGGVLETSPPSTTAPDTPPRYSQDGWVPALLISTRKPQQHPQPRPPVGTAGGGLVKGWARISCRPQTLPLLVGVQAMLPRSDQPISRCRSESFRDMLHVQQCRLVLLSPSPSSCRGLPPQLPYDCPTESWAGQKAQRRVQQAARCEQ